MFKFPVRAAVAAAVGILIGGGATFLAVPRASAADSGIKVIVVDQQSVLRDSMAGQDITRQAAALRDQIQGEVLAEQKAIVAAQKDLQTNASMYSPSQRETKIKALEARQNAYPQFEQRKQQILQASIGQASDQVAAALRPVLQQLINENKATLLLDRGQVMYAAPSYDVTQEAIKRLNASIKSVKVVRVNLDSMPGIDQTNALRPASPSTTPKPPAAQATAAPAPATHQ